MKVVKRVIIEIDGAIHTIKVEDWSDFIKTGKLCGEKLDNAAEIIKFIVDYCEK